MPLHWLAAYQAQLANAGDPIRAASMAAYMKNIHYFIGIPTPIRRKLCKSIEIAASRELTEAQLMALAQLLWQQREREYHYCAIDLLARSQQKLTASAMPELEMLITTHSWWDSIDGIASNIVGPLALRESAVLARLDQLVSDENLWLRRTAILYQLSYKSATDETRLFHACLSNAADPDFFIRKAIGWVLRQYARVAPQAVRDFVAAQQARLSPLSQREALNRSGIRLRSVHYYSSSPPP